MKVGVRRGGVRVKGGGERVSKDSKSVKGGW